MRPFYVFSFLLSLFIISCKSASKAYQQGDYNDAIDLAIKKLQKNPKDAEAAAVLQKAYTYAVNQHQDNIRILNNSTSNRRWDEMYDRYSELQHLYQTVNRYPAAAAVVRATDYSSYVQTYAGKAADVHYEKGMTLLNENDKRAYREAYQEFKTALRYKPEDMGIQRKMEEAYDQALLKVLVTPVEDYDRYYYNRQSMTALRFSDNIVRNLNYRSGNDFVQFFPAWEDRSQSGTPDEVLDMRFGAVTIGRPVDKSETRKISKEVVAKEIVYSKDSVVKQYATVYAYITTTRRTLVSNADLLLASHGPNGAMIWSDVVRGQHRWQVEFATYTGDERALSDSDKALLNRPVVEPPHEEIVFTELLQQLERDAASKVRYYYSRY